MKHHENNQNEEQTGFGLPGDYFSAGTTALQNRMLWLEEHREFPALRMAWRKEGFDTPADYFSKQELQLELIAYPTLQNAEKKNAFSAPDAYLEKQLETSAIRIAGLVPVKESFSVPPEYFAKSAGGLAALKEKKEDAKILSLSARVLRFAAAAMLLLSASWWFYTKSDTVLPAQDCGGLACIDRKEIIKDKSIELLDEEDLNSLVNPNKLENALQNKLAPRPYDSLNQEEDFLDNL